MLSNIGRGAGAYQSEAKAAVEATPKEFDYLDFHENERRLQELTRPGNLDRFKSLLQDKPQSNDIYP